VHAVQLALLTVSSSAGVADCCVVQLALLTVSSSAGVADCCVVLRVTACDVECTAQFNGLCCSRLLRIRECLVVEAVQPQFGCAHCSSLLVELVHFVHWISEIFVWASVF
jgi:hypothetical protein